MFLVLCVCLVHASSLLILLVILMLCPCACAYHGRQAVLRCGYYKQHLSFSGAGSDISGAR